jgi:RNA polymerase sigma-70 factor, ECF subfamily
MGTMASPRPGRRVSSSEIDDLTLARAQRGDGAAFALLVRHYQQGVFAFLFRMLGRRGERALVEDLTQDTFVNVHRGLPGWDPRGPARLRTWILTIASRVALNELRRPVRALEPMGGRAEAVAAPGSDAALVLIVREGLERMTPDHRAVLLLREYHALDYEEIARALDIDVGTVKSRLSRARAALRALLTENEP